MILFNLDLKQRKLRELISQLAQIKGRHTELVSVYVPADYNLNKVVEQIRSEQSTAQNIKSKTVRKNVLSALEKILQHLKLYKQTPANGLVIFCGNVSLKEGVSDIELWSLEPPESLKQRLYRCDQYFILDPLKEIIREKEVYGLVVMDKSDAEIGLLKGKKVESLKHLDSLVPGKSKAGGWSAKRFERVREGLLHDFFKKVGEIASVQFKSLKDLKGVIIAGPGPIKDDFAAGDFLDYDVKNKILGIVNTSYTGRYGLEETVDRSEEILAKASVMREKKILTRFFTGLAKGELAIYGFHETLQALKSGGIDILLLSEAFDWVKTNFECLSCGNRIQKILREEQLKLQKCPKCNSKLEIIETQDLTDELVKLAEQMNTNVEMISTDTREGEQLKELGGIAGILRYRLS